jgi:hypothetical protein
MPVEVAVKVKRSSEKVSSFNRILLPNKSGPLGGALPKSTCARIFTSQ